MGLAASRRRLFAFGAAVALAGLTAVVPALGDEPSDDQHRAPALLGEGYEGPSQDERRARQQQERDLPERRADRERSKSLYRDLSRADALGLARKVFPAQVEREKWEPLDLGRGERVERWLGSTVARIERPNGDRFLVDSMLPLRSRVGTGELAPVDMTLEARSGGFRLRNPLAQLEIAEGLSGGVRLLDSGLGFRLEASGSDEPVRIDDKLFFSNVGVAGSGGILGGQSSDTDFVVSPVPTGVAAEFVLRSSLAPESFRLRFDLPPGATLRALEGLPGAAEIVRGDDQLALISPPVAFGADGEPVPVRYAFDGRTLVIRVTHRLTDVHYPVYVDPVIDSYRINEDGSPTTVDDPVFQGWTPRIRKQGPVGNIYVSRNGRHGNGLYVYTRPPAEELTETAYEDYGAWIYTAIRQAHIERVDFGYVTHLIYPPTATGQSRYQGDCVFEGIFAPSLNAWESGTWYHANGVSGSSPWSTYASPRSGTNVDACAPLSGNYKAHHLPAGVGAPGTQAWYGLAYYSTVPVRTEETLAYMYGAKVHVSDRDDPVIESLAPDFGGRWQDGRNFTVTTTARDPGLGIWAWNLFRDPVGPVGTNFIRPDGSTWVYSGSGPIPSSAGVCEGNHQRTCPERATTVIRARDQQPDGQHTFGLEAYDILGKSTGPGQLFSVKLDSSSPSIASVSGSLYDQRATLFKGARTLSVSATDGESGVERIEVRIGGSLVKSVDFTCDAVNGCPGPWNTGWTVDSSEFDGSESTVEITAFDMLNHPSAPFTFDIRTDTMAPVATISGSPWDADEDVATEPPFAVTVTAADGDDAFPEAGVKSIEIFVAANSDTETPSWVRVLNEAQTPTLEMERTWNWNPPDGDYRVLVRVTDGFDNYDDHYLQTTVLREQEEPPDSDDSGTHATATHAGAAGEPGERSGSAVANLGDISGDGYDDYAVGAPDASVGGKQSVGRVTVWSGRFDGRNTGQTLYVINGPGEYARLGAAVSSAGDVNGDGYADILIGAPNDATELGKGTLLEDKGYAYVIFGRAPSEASEILDTSSLGSRGFLIIGPAEPPTAIADPSGLSRRRFGASVAGGRPGEWGTYADFNGDGLDDVVIGSSTENLRTGAAYVIHGKRDTNTVSVASLSGKGVRISGAAAEDKLGYAVSIPGDVDGDNRADVLIGAPGRDLGGRPDSGTAYLVYGGSAETVEPESAAASVSRTIRGGTGDKLGRSLAAAGELSGDDSPDMIFGGVRTHVMFGQTVRASVIDLGYGDAPGYRIEPPLIAGGAVSTVSGGPDLNSDRVPDVLVSYPNATDSASRLAQGVVYAVFGPRDVGQTLSLEGLGGHVGTKLLGATGAEGFGTAIDGLDVGVDGRAAVVAGAPGAAVNHGKSAQMSSATMAGADAQQAAANKCYKGLTTAYGYSHPNDHKICRRTTVANFYERTPKVQGINYRRTYGNGRRDVRGPLNTTSDANGWAVVDSRGQKFGYIKLRNYNNGKLKPHEFEIRDENGTPWGVTQGRATVQVQGRACMARTGLENQYVMISLRSDKNNTASNGRDVGVRGFIRRSALRPGTFREKGDGNATNDQVIDRFRTGCGQAHGANASHTIVKPDYEKPEDRYQGRRQGLTCSAWTAPNGSTQPGFTNPSCGGQYHDYSRPAFNLEIVPIMTASTGVRGGGIVRGIIRRGSAAVPFVRQARIGYIDLNVPCTKRPMAQWFFGDGYLSTASGSRHIYGWLPYPRAPQAPRTAGCP